MIYSIDMLRLTWWVQGNSLYKRIAYQIQSGKLFRIRNGIFSDIPLKRLSYEDSRIIATQSGQLGYLSFETILGESGINSQYSNVWHIATPEHSRNMHIQILDMNIYLQHIPEEIFYNQLGIIHENGYSRATPERAITDTLGRSPLYHFDVLPPTLDWSLLSEIGELWKEISPRTYTRIMKICSSVRNI